MRKKMTKAEAIFWEHLRNNKLGVKFRRQQIIDGYVAEFYCERAKLVIEVDGEIHDTEEQKKYDEHRTNVFNNRGLTEIRFRNEMVIYNCSSVLNEIRKYILVQI